MRFCSSLFLLPASVFFVSLSAYAQSPPPLMDAMSAELHRAMTSLATPASGAPADAHQAPYYMSFAAHDRYAVAIMAEQGALMVSDSEHQRTADIVVRVGDPKLDNTHGDHRSSAIHTVSLPLDDDRPAIERSLWWATNTEYRRALETYLQVKTDEQVRAKEEDTSPDFSEEKPVTAIAAPAAAPQIDTAAWNNRMKALSATFRRYPHIYTDFVMMTVENETSYFVSSEGTQIVTPHRAARVVALAVTRADDGMDLFRAATFEAETPDTLPSQAAMADSLDKLAASLEQLRTAPVTEPFSGPAILSGRAAAVFFHEVLGHRLEGQRQRGDSEGETFTKDVGKPILPDFMSVADDPTQHVFHGTWLSGSYAYDDEGQQARKVDLIDDGVLKTFLMSRLPIASFSASNGHGRAQDGLLPTGRQGNLIVSSTKSVTDSKLRQMLIDEAKKQGKPYGLYFEDISSGFALTTRAAPQAFSVVPLVVWRVYTDGRADELVRGVSIVGTPQAALKSILATGDTSEVFNGQCGAESGTIPVSAVSPAILMSELETQREPQGTARPPILPPPTAEGAAEVKP
ncbi:MAG TPA: metallopeptidase TldD-related protein [Acidobacteriaceae bacterium]|jgi:predicted Zn-dependent protease|nr:metallopeptidase TldD-related protein [Acidobacteriaceae bacterium]